MKIRILWVGKTKERYLNDGIAYYLKLLQKQINITIIEIKDSKGEDRNKIITEESKRILSNTTSYVLLDENGSLLTSKEFAIFLSTKTSLDFVIGGSFGVSNEVKKKASFILSLSPMTFTHEMVRLFLLEQLYRSIKIIKGLEYHY